MTGYFAARKQLVNKLHDLPKIAPGKSTEIYQFALCLADEITELQGLTIDRGVWITSTQYLQAAREALGNFSYLYLHPDHAVEEVVNNFLGMTRKICPYNFVLQIARGEKARRTSEEITDILLRKSG